MLSQQRMQLSGHALTNAHASYRHIHHHHQSLPSFLPSFGWSMRHPCSQACCTTSPAVNPPWAPLVGIASLPSQPLARRCTMTLSGACPSPKERVARSPTRKTFLRSVLVAVAGKTGGGIRQVAQVPPLHMFGVGCRVYGESVRV